MSRFLVQDINDLNIVMDMARILLSDTESLQMSASVAQAQLVLCLLDRTQIKLYYDSELSKYIETNYAYSKLSQIPPLLSRTLCICV